MRFWHALLLLGVIMFFVLTPASATFVPRPVAVFDAASLTPLVGDTHAHSIVSDAHAAAPALTAPETVARSALSTQDFFLLTDHAEQISSAELRVLVRTAELLSAEGKLFDFGQEWTGIPDEGDPGIVSNPAYVQGGGHVLLYRSTQVIGHHSQGGGEPNVIAASFVKLLRLLPERAETIGGFAHPERYAVETTFGGFMAPENEAQIRQMAVCELAGHGARGYYGPGDPKQGIRASNEAGFRQLIRVGWQPCPSGGTDRHLYPYEPGPYTIAFASERSVEGIYEAILRRHTCFSEDRYASLRMVGWWDDLTNSPLLMGAATLTSGSTLYVHAEVTGPEVRGINFVTVGRAAELDVEYASHRLEYGERNYGIALDVATLRRQGVRAVYAKAVLQNKKNVIGAPIFIEAAR